MTKKIIISQKLLNNLADSVSGLTITEISNEIKIYRNIASKYLNVY